MFNFPYRPCSHPASDSLASFLATDFQVLLCRNDLPPILSLPENIVTESLQHVNSELALIFRSRLKVPRIGKGLSIQVLVSTQHRPDAAPRELSLSLMTDGR